MGIYSRYIRPGRVIEVSLIGFVLLIAAIAVGGMVTASPTLAPLFTFSPMTLCWMLITYGFVAAVLPVWLLLAPRDYLSTFLKIGAIVSLAIGIIVLAPELKMPATTVFVNGLGPVWKGSGLSVFVHHHRLRRRLRISLWLVSSGTTPKLLAREKDARFIGYGAMLMESFVAVMALCAASILEPGVYFSMNTPPAVIGVKAGVRWQRP